MRSGNTGIAIRSIGVVSRFGVGYPAFMRGLFDPCVPGENPSLSEYEMASLAIREAVQPLPVNIENSALILATTARQTDGNTAESLLEFLGEGFGVSGVRLCFVNACSAGISALGAAVSILLTGNAETVLVVGVVADLEDNRKGFASLGVAGDQPSRPFSLDRQFMELGMGAVCIRLERAQSDQDVTLQTLMTGFRGDNMVRPNADYLSGFYRQTVQSLAAVPEVFIAHGTGTIPNDQAESVALHSTFPSGVRATSVKSAAGHTLEASALFNLAAAYGVYEKMQLPVTRNCPDSMLTPPVMICNQEEFLYEAPDAVMGASIGMDGNVGGFVIGRNLPAASLLFLSPVAASFFTPWMDVDSPVTRQPGEPVGGAAGVIFAVLQELQQRCPETPLFDDASEIVLAVSSAECYPGNFSGRRMTPADFFGRLYSFPLAMAARQVGHQGSLSACCIGANDLLDVLFYGWTQTAARMLRVCSVLELGVRKDKICCRGLVLADRAAAMGLPVCLLDELSERV